MSVLKQQHCAPCEGGATPLTKETATKLIKQTPAWRLTDDGKSLRRHLEFKDFVAAMRFVNEVAALAEDEGHHTDIAIFWNKVELTLSTHAIGGLSNNDFILAAKINELPAV